MPPGGLFKCRSPFPSPLLLPFLPPPRLFSLPRSFQTLGFPISNLCSWRWKYLKERGKETLATGESLDFEKRTVLFAFIPTMRTAAICVWGMLSDIQMIEKRRKHLEWPIQWGLFFFLKKILLVSGKTSSSLYCIEDEAHPQKNSLVFVIYVSYAWRWHPSTKIKWTDALHP